MAYVVVAALVLFLSPALALNPSKSLYQYVARDQGLEDGLPQNSILSLIQTSDGYVWFGTWEGLVRTDGVRHRVFDTSNTPELKVNGVQELLEDQGGNLWIGTYGGGLLRYRNGQFQRYDKSTGLSDDRILALAEAASGEIWIGTYSGGLNRLTPGPSSKVARDDRLPRDVVHVIERTSDDTMMVGTRKGLFKFEDDTFREVTDIGKLGGGAINAIVEDVGGQLWVGGEFGLCRLAKDGATCFDKSDGLLDLDVRGLLSDRHGSLWIATYNRGVHLLRGDRFLTYRDEDPESQAHIRNLLEDREGNIWIGFFDNGYRVLSDGSFSAFSTSDGMISDMVLGIMQDRQERIWFGTDVGAATLFEGQVRPFPHQEALPATAVITAFEDDQGLIWLGTDSGGIATYDGERVRVLGLKGDLRSSRIFAFVQDITGAVWAGTRNKGIIRVLGEEMENITQNEGLADNRVHALHSDAQGNLWIGTEAGLNRMTGDQFKLFTTDDGLSNNRIFSLYGDPQGNLWIGTYGGGLNLLKDGKFAAFTQENGFFNNVVYTVLEDDVGYLWMSCNIGVFRVAKQQLLDYASLGSGDLDAEAFGVSDGMHSRECNGGYQHAGIKARDGRLWFGTLKGAVVVDPSNLARNPVPPPVVVEQVIIDNHRVAADSVVPPNPDNIEIHYTGLSFTAPGDVKFKYRLSGHDKHWAEVGARRVAYYTNLPPGKYTFEVTACNNDGVWAEHPAAFSFSVEPTFYQTTWFYVLCLAACLGLFYLFYRARVYAIEKEKQRLEGLVTLRTKELHLANDDLQTANKSLAQARDEIWGEMKLAKKIQTALLPANPVVDGYEISTHMAPADEVGGDYYDIINAAGRSWITIGDVSGHGVSAGLIMMMIQTAIDAVLRQNPDYSPSELLAGINQTITRNIQNLGENMYITITVIAALEDGALHFAGLHQDLLIYRGDSGEVDTLETDGMWVGIVDEIDEMLVDDSFTLHPRDVLLLYTDGITEARSPDEELFSQERLTEVLKDNGHLGAGEIKGAILNALGDYETDDDITMLVFKKLAG